MIPRIALGLLCVMSVACQSAVPSPPVSSLPNAGFDVLITGGHVVDGTGAPWVSADVGIRGDRIAAIGRLGDQQAALRIDATGLIVSPGFIDMLGQSEFNVLVDGRAASKITQGVTTEITGEGSSIAPMNARLFELAKPQYAR